MKNVTLSKKTDQSFIALTFIVGIWLIYTVIYQMLKQHLEVSGILEFLMVNGLNAAVAIYFWNSWKSVNQDSSSKKILMFFALSYGVVVIESSIYHAIYNVLHIPRSQVPLFWLSFYNFLYVVYLLLQLFAWAAILSMVRKNQKKPVSLSLPVLSVILAIVFVGFYILRGSANLSFFGIYDFSDKLLEITYLVMVILCLITCRNKGLFYFAIGILISESSSLLMDFGILSQGFGAHSFLETGWVLGKLFMLYGLIRLSSTAIEDAQAWLIAPDQVSAQRVSVIFRVGIPILAILFAAAYVFYPRFF